MKQIQFEVNNNNTLKKELARIKRFVKNEPDAKVVFQIYTCLEDLDQISELTGIIEQTFPDSLYYGGQTFGNICEGKLSASRTVVVCSIFEYETTKATVLWINPKDASAKHRDLHDLWQFCNTNSWVKGVEITTSFNAAMSLGVGNKMEPIRDDIVVFGGIACNPNSLDIFDTYVFAKGYGISSDAAVAVVLGGEDIHVSACIVKGWEGLGKSFEITACEGNVIRTIDNEPAMNIYKKYLGVEQGNDLSVDGMLFPLLVEQNGMEDIRIPTRGGVNGELALLVDVKQGQRVRLSYGEKSTILSYAKDTAKKMAEFAPDSVRICSCAARRAFWGDGEISRESLIFENLASTVGFYTRGEIFRTGNFLNYLNQTMVICLLREGEAFEYEFDINEAIDSEDDSVVAGLAPKLIKYISAVTDELESQFSSTMRGISNNYRNMFLIDLENETLTQIDSNKRDAAFLEQRKNYDDKLKFFIRNTVALSMQYAAVNFCDLGTLKERLKNTETASAEFIGKMVGWFRAQFFVVDRDHNGEPSQVVFTTQVIDAEKRASEEQQRIIQSLANTYFRLHVFDLRKDIVTTVSAQNLVGESFQDNRVKGCQKEITEATYVNVTDEYLEQMLSFTDFSTLSERMRDKKTITTEFVGTNGWARATFIAIDKNGVGEITKALFAIKLIDDEKKREESLLRDANTDELTGLFNRRSYSDDLRAISEDPAQRKNLILVGLDINGLKTANDTLGHAAGDELIQGTAECIKRCLGSYGKVYRIGGDEFFAMLYVDRDRFEHIMADYEASVSEWKGKLVESLSVSIGHVIADEFPDSSLDELIQETDKRMYVDKDIFYKNSGLERRR